MKKAIISLFLAITLFGCGISEKDKERAQFELNQCLYDMYVYSADMNIMFLNTEIVSMEKSDGSFMHADYYGTFRSTFDYDGKDISIHGICGFDKDFRVVQFDNFMSIDIVVVLEGAKQMELKDNPFVLKNMVNHWKPTAK